MLVYLKFTVWTSFIKVKKLNDDILIGENLI